MEGECEDLDWKRRSGRKNTMDILTTTGNDSHGLTLLEEEKQP